MVQFLSWEDPMEKKANPVQYSCLENPIDREALWATVHGVSRVGHDLATKAPPPIQDHTNIQFLFKLPYTDFSIHWTVTY